MQAITKKVVDLNTDPQGIEELKQLYKNVFTSGAGEIVLEDLKQRCYYNAATASPKESIEPEQVIFREGMRSVLLLIIDNLEHEPQE